MIVPSMSLTEIHKELTRDYDYCLARIKRDMNQYRRSIIKSSKFPMQFKPIEYVSPSRNHFIILIDAKSKKQANTPFFCIVGYYLRPEGIYAALLIPKIGGGKRIILYPPHFFERYKQRYLNEDVCTLDAIKTYFKVNSTNIIEFGENNKFRGSCYQGLILGEKLCDDILIIKTFVSKEMLKGEQIENNDKIVNQLSILNELKSNKNYTDNMLIKLMDNVNGKY